MGAWGSGPFENDDAMDWVAELESARDLAAVRSALEAVTRAEEYIDAPAGSIALASAEVVAALRGRPVVDLPPEVTNWVAKQRGLFDAALITMAAQAVQIVLSESSRSELSELWNEADDDDRDAWRAATHGLLDRLR
jgi:hypothetical protein